MFDETPSMFTRSRAPRIVRHSDHTLWPPHSDPDMEPRWGLREGVPRRVPPRGTDGGGGIEALRRDSPRRTFGSDSRSSGH